MRIRIDHGQMKNVTDKLSTESVLLLNEIITMKNSIEELKTVWQGEDADVFYARINAFFENLKNIPATYDKMSDYLNRANIKYKEADLALKNAISSVRMN